MGMPAITPAEGATWMIATVSTGGAIALAPVL